MIFHLLIVDDEPTIRKGLSSFIKWDTYDCVVDGTACDGQEAMEMIQKKQPDIVISDIRMPQADGITLSQFISENYPETLVILLTGYADFQYAQSAIRYGVIDFILKPTSREKLIEAVKKAQSCIVEYRNRNQVSSEDFTYLQEQYLEELTGIPDPDPQFCAKAAHYGIKISDYFAAAFQINSITESANIEELSILKEVLLKQGQAHYAYSYGNHLVLWICQIQASPAKELDLLVKNCQDIAASMDSLYALKCSMGISLSHNNANQLSIAAKEAISALNMNFYNDTLLSVYTPQMGKTIYEIDAEYTLDLYHFEDCLKTWEFDQALQMIRSMFSKLKINLTRSYEVKNICIQIYYIFSRILIKKNLVPENPDILQKIQQCTTIGQLELLINQMFQRETARLTTKGKELSPLIEKSVQYIRSHLEEALSLETISTFVHVNPSHLSRTFKKECGESITEFINKVRIEKAQELLTFSHTLSYEVAEKAGFNDPAYFSATFKKYTGLSPKEFKQIYGEK